MPRCSTIWASCCFAALRTARESAQSPISTRPRAWTGWTRISTLATPTGSTATRQLPRGGSGKRCVAIRRITPLISCSALRSTPWGVQPRRRAKRISRDGCRRPTRSGSATSPSGSVPRGLERVRMDLDLPDAVRVENVIGRRVSAISDNSRRFISGPHVEHTRPNATLTRSRRCSGRCTCLAVRPRRRTSFSVESICGAGACPTRSTR